METEIPNDQLIPDLRRCSAKNSTSGGMTNEVTNVDLEYLIGKASRSKINNRSSSIVNQAAWAIRLHVPATGAGHDLGEKSKETREWGGDIGCRLAVSGGEERASREDIGGSFARRAAYFA